MSTRNKWLLANSQYFSCFATWEFKVHHYIKTYSCSSGWDFFLHLVTCLSNSCLKFQMSGFGGARGEGTWRQFPPSEVLSHLLLHVNLFPTWHTFLLPFFFLISLPTCRPAVPPSFGIGCHYPCCRALI